MADEGKAALEWVDAPQVVDGKVAYSYRNSGTAAANTVFESVTVTPATGDQVVQSFMRRDVAAGADHTTHAPVGEGMDDGKAYVTVSLQAASETEYVAQLDVGLDAMVSAGVLVAAGAVPETAPLGVEISAMHLDGSDLVLMYRIVGGGNVDLANAFVQLVHNDAGEWMGNHELSNDREDVARVSIPLDLVEGEGWSLQASITAMSGDKGSGVRCTAPLVRDDGGGVTAGAWATETFGSS